MLQTQVGYWQNVETQRHNLVTESQNAIELGIKRDTLSESIRHNIESENISWFNAQETQRHNVVNENISWFNAHESQRHNRVTESLGYAQLGESHRHNIVGENIDWHNLGVQQLKTNIEGRKATAQIADWNAAADKAKADADLASERARTETSNRFVNWTSGAQNISKTVKDVSDIVSTWVGFAGGSGEAGQAAKVLRKAAKAAGRSKK